MDAKEHKDLYIALAVGGVTLVLVFLYMSQNSSITVTPATDTATTPATTTAEAPPPITPYNYNIEPYSPGPLLANAAPNVSNNVTIGGNGNGCSGCANKKNCGPLNGNAPDNCTVAQYQTLMDTGAG